MTKTNSFDKLYFIYQRWGGSTYIMLYQAFIVCESLGVSSSVLHVSELSNSLHLIKNSVLIFLKQRMDQSLIDKIKENNNTIILIPGDGNVFQMTDYLKKISDIDGVVVASAIYKENLDSLNKFKVRVIPHNYDYFLDSNTFKKQRDSQFKLYYGGMEATVGPTQGKFGLKNYPEFYEGYFRPIHFALKDVSIDNNSFDFRDRQRFVLAAKTNPEVIQHINSDINPSKYSCHYSVRCPKFADTALWWIAKSATKVIIAAGSESNIITSLDPPVRVLIDESYPYSINTETDEFLSDPDRACMDMIEYAKQTYKTSIWYDALDIMLNVKKKVSTQSIVKKYLSFAEELV